MKTYNAAVKKLHFLVVCGRTKVGLVWLTTVIVERIVKGGVIGYALL